VALLLALAATANADVVRILDDPRDAAQVRVDLIQQARSEIDAVYFLARNDRITLAALALLRDARRRGVGEVRLIVDANFQHIPKAVLAHLRQEGVLIKVYHPLTLRHPSWLFRRMHEKVVLVDDRRYVTGGRNLAEGYFGLAKKNYVDRDIYVDGPSAHQASQHFDELWNSAHVADLRVRVSAEECKRASEWLDRSLHELECDRFLELNTGCDWSHGENDAGPVRFVADSAARNERRVGGTVADAIGAARRSIVIESPYLVPSRPMLDLLEKKAAEGVSVLIVTNSIRSTDGLLPQAGYFKYRRQVLRAGIEVAEFKGPDTLHAKSIVIDGRIALVGSYNLDPRSENLNTEVMCVADNETIARQLLDAIDLHVRNAWRAQEREPGERRFGLWGARLLLPLIENQL
jgi:cardiolipin synthase C